MHQEHLMKGHNTTEQGCGFKCLSWTAVIVGTLVGLGLSFLLSLFGMAIGLAAYTTSPEGITTLVVSGFIGMAIGIMIVMFVAGWVSGFLGRPYCINCNLGVLYGFTTWSLAIVLSVILSSNMGQFMAMQYSAFTNPNSIALKISSQHNAESEPAVTTRSVSSRGAERTQVVVNDEKAAKALGKTLLLVFLLFFVGALTSSYGGYVGMNAARRKMNP